MERLIKTLGDGLDRRSFFRKLGKLGMGAAAIAGVLLLPRADASAACGDQYGNSDPKDDCYLAYAVPPTACKPDGRNRPRTCQRVGAGKSCDCACKV